MVMIFASFIQLQHFKFLKAVHSNKIMGKKIHLLFEKINVTSFKLHEKKFESVPKTSQTKKGGMPCVTPTFGR